MLCGNRFVPYVDQLQGQYLEKKGDAKAVSHITLLRDHRKSSQKPTKRTKFVWGTNKIRLGGGSWNENRNVGFTVRVLLKLVVTLKPGLREIIHLRGGGSGPKLILFVSWASANFCNDPLVDYLVHDRL